MTNTARQNFYQRIDQQTPLRDGLTTITVRLGG